MSGTNGVPPARQCTHPDCAREVINTDCDGQRCEQHLAALKANSEVSVPAQDGSAPLQIADAVAAHASAEPEYPESIIHREWWVAWILDGVERKRPVAPWQTGHAYPVEWRADLDDERPEIDFETAKRWVDFPLDDLGLALPDDALSDTLRLGVILPVDRPPRDERIVLIDWDDVRDPETGEIHPVAAAFIDEHGGYVEISRSGEGLHQFVFGGLRHRDKFIAPIDTEPFVGDDRPQVEIYDGGRHVAMTGQHVYGTDPDVVEGQDCIDAIVSEYADAELDAGHRSYDPATGATPSDNDRADDASGKSAATPTPEPEPCEYQGPPIDEIRETCPPDRSLAYHAVIEAFCEGYAGVLNWRLEGAAAALGQREDRTVEEVVEDLRGAHRDGGSVGYDKKTPGRVAYDHKRAGRGEFAPASYETLASWGVLPGEFVEQLNDDDNEGSARQPVSALPLAQLDALKPEQRRRAARKRGLEWPTTNEARSQLFDELAAVMRHEDDRVIDAPTSLGKSYTVDATRWGARDDLTGDQPVVHLSATRKARDEAAATAAEEGGDHMVLLSRHEACPVAAGDHDPDQEDDENDRQILTMDGQPASEWIDDMCNTDSGKGLPFSAVHRHLEEQNDQGVDLPCCRDVECDAIQQYTRWRDGDHPLVIATHNFAHIPGLRTGTNVVVDEEPDFDVELSTDRVQRAVGAYIQEIDAPVSTWEAFTQLARYEGYGDDAAIERAALEDALDETPERSWYFDNPDAHTLAPALARAIFHADDRGNGRRVGKTPYEPPRLDAEAREDDGWNREWVSVVLDDSDTRTEIRSVRSVPDLSAARSVVGLDAHPALPVWQVNTVPWIQDQAVLEPEERKLWRRYERGLRVAQVGDATRPLTSGEYFDTRGTEAVLEHLHDEYGDDFRTAITAKNVEDRLETLMDDVGIADPELMHYGDVKSRNDFDGETVGFVNGCIDPGDNPILDLLAELDLDAEPKRAEVCCEHCGDRDAPEEAGRGCQDCDGTGWSRAHGREFTGPHADKAQAILAAVRENEVAQAAGRYGRNPDDPSDTATVFVRTDATPTGFVDVQVPGTEWVYTGKQEQVVEALSDRERPATARELADETGISKRHVHRVLERLLEHDSVQAYERAGPNGATLYADTGLPDAGVVDLTHEDGEVVTAPVWGSYTWSVAIHGPDRCCEVSEADSAGSPTQSEGLYQGIDADGEGYIPPDDPL